MPISKYDRYFGGKPGSAQKALKGMREQYGKEKGEQVFYATIARKKKRRHESTKVRVGGK